MSNAYQQIIKTFIAFTGIVVLSLLFIPPVTTYAQLTPPAPVTSEYNGELAGNPIFSWINFFINLLAVTILAGSAVMIAWAGVQYMSAKDNAQAVQAAKQKIWNVMIGLLAFFFLYSFIQWLIPGGVF